MLACLLSSGSVGWGCAWWSLFLRDFISLQLPDTHLCLFHGYTGIVTRSWANLVSGTVGCLSEMAFAVSHLTLWGLLSVFCCRGSNTGWHFALRTVAASNSHCANFLVERSRKLGKRLQTDFFFEAYKFNAWTSCIFMQKVVLLAIFIVLLQELA